jgi:hypothetical protein
MLSQVPAFVRALLLYSGVIAMLRNLLASLVVGVLVAASSSATLAQTGSITDVQTQVNGNPSPFYSPGDRLRGGASATVSSPTPMHFRLRVEFFTSSEALASGGQDDEFDDAATLAEFTQFDSIAQMTGDWYDFIATVEYRRNGGLG